MKTKSVIILSGILILISGLGGILIGKNYYPKKEYVIVEKIVTKTVYKKIAVSPEELKACYDSPIAIDGEFKEDVLKVTAQDDCKKASADFKIKARQTQNHIVQLGYLFSSKSLDVTYLYNFDIVSIGGGLVGNQDKLDYKVVVQKTF